MPVSFNEDTGELLTLDDGGKWVKPTVAVNPQTQEKLYHDGADWKPVPLTKADLERGRVATIGQGLTFGGFDEIAPVLYNPLSAARAAIGIEPKTGDYYYAQDQIRQDEKAYAKARPWEHFGVTLAGGALPAVATGGAALGAAARVLPNAGRVAQAAAVGAGFGAPTGFLSSEGGLTERAKGAGVGLFAGGVLGGAVEVASPVLQWAYRAIRGNPNLINPQTGQLTPQGVQAAQNAGFDPAQASAELNREFGAVARDAVNPGDAAAVAQARSLPVPVQLRQGQVTLNPDQQMFESQAAKEVYGPLAGNAMRASEADQQAALRGNVAAIQNRIGGGQVGELQQGVNAAQQQLSGMERASKANVNRLYDAARESSGAATVEGPQVSQAVFDIGTLLNRQGFTRRAAGRVHEVLDELGGLASQSQVRPATNIGEIFARRQELSALSQGLPSAETTAAGTAKRGIDRWIARALDEDMITGDPQAIELWRAAIQSRRGHGQMYGGGDLVEKLVARQPNGSAELKLDTSGAANLIFGRSNTGWVGKSGMTRDLARLRSVLGQESPQWNALREEAFVRLSRSGEGANQPLGADFSGGNFAKAWQKALTDSPEVLRILFSDQERALITQFANVARRVTTSVRGGSNASNTSAGMIQATRRLMASTFMGPKMAALLDSTPILKGLSNIGNELRANRAVLGQLQRGYQPVPEASAAALRTIPALANYGAQRENK